MRVARAIRVLVALGLAGTTATAVADAPSLPTLVPGVLTVSLSLPSPGLQAGAVRDGEVVVAKGYEVDVARALAARLGVPTVRFVTTAPAARLVAPGTTNWDVALAEVMITSAHQAAVDMTGPYLSADLGVLGRHGLTARVRTARDLRPLRLCAVRATPAAAFIRTHLRPSRTPSIVPSTTVLFQRLQAGSCDAAVGDLPVLAARRALFGDRYGALLGRIRTGEAYGVVLTRGNPLTPSVDAAVAALGADGTLARLGRRWFGGPLGRVRVLADAPTGAYGGIMAAVP